MNNAPSTVHPHWNPLIQWLADHGMRSDELRVVARCSSGAGYGLFAAETIEPSTPLFSIPANALLNSLTLAPHYPSARPKLTCTQFVSLHLLLHRPLNDQSDDPLFGPYISVLPRSFDSHPLTWLRKQEHSHLGLTVESQLLETLPSRILTKLNRISDLFKKDWERIQAYLGSNPSLLDNRSVQTGSSTPSLEEDYLWAWLNVNTRCVYHRLAKTRSDPDNMTLCPILDFANHTTTAPYTLPKATRAELWDIGPSPKRKFGDNFTLLSPSTAVRPGQELYLRYGVHANSTLFAEYGFVNLETSGENFEGDVELDVVIEQIFERRERAGSWMKDILVEEGYWGDWTMHTSPAPAHPSYRLITTLRLYHIFRDSINSIPPNSDHLLQEWRNTTLGHQDIISHENEQRWRATLLHLCEDLIIEAEKGVAKVRMVGADIEPSWVASTKVFVETLWREETFVASSVIESLRKNVDF